jgi:hypothetical protein
MANSDDEQFKNYLNSFRPVTPEPLHVKRYPVRARRLFTLAAAAASIAAIVLVVLLLSRSRQRVLSPTAGSSANQEIAWQPLASSSRSQLSTPRLTKLALDDHEAFDEIMREKVRTQFPPMNGEQSALRVLAQEQEERTK